MSTKSKKKPLNSKKTIAAKKVVKKAIKQEELNSFILLDRSGSMSGQWEESLSAINAYVEKLNKDKVKGTVTVATFDTDNIGNNSYEVIRDHSVLKDYKAMSKSEIWPRGMTPLYDAVGKCFIAAKADDKKRTAIIIMTDGQENHSREYDLPKVKKLVEEAKSKKWEVIFLGANFDVDTYKNVGLGTNKLYGGTTQTLAKRMVDTGTKMSAYTMTGAAVNYSAEEKAAAWDKTPDPTAKPALKPIKTTASTKTIYRK